MTTFSRLAVMLAAAITLPAVAADAEWDPKWYNPVPADGDLVLPIRCGGGIVFRPVDVPATMSPLADRAVTFGEPQTELGFLDYERGAYIAAPFPTGASARRYYIGKYDVTRDQFAAIRAGECVAPTPTGRLPQANVSWIDAVQAAADLSTWWLANARDKLPKRGDSFGYARLPTEDEWEYAARGGASVSESDFLAQTWPMPEGIERYAQAGSRVTAGRAQQVGGLKPNPLGLYDMLGNVDQMMLESFRLNRVGRLHGQAGGIVVRGGNYTSLPSSLRTAMRAELPPYDGKTNTPTKLATVGFRLVLSAPTTGSLPEAEQARKSFSDELGRRENVPDDPAQLITLLRESLPDESLRRNLDRISAKLASESRDRTDQLRVTMLAQMEAGAVMANFVWTLERSARQLDSMVDGVSAGHPDEQERLRAAAKRRRDQQSASLDGYLRLLRGISLSAVSPEIEAQSALLRQELTSRGQKQLFDMLTVLTKHAVFERAGQSLPRTTALADIDAVPVSDATR